MATSNAQRTGIWVIAIVMLVGTIGGFAAMVLATQNSANETTEYQKLLEQQQKLMEEAQKKQQEEADKLSSQHYESFKQYKTAPAAFDPASVGKSVATRDIEAGSGAEITKDTKYKAYYIGWNPKGVSFDSSFDGDKLKAPINTQEVTLIDGWSQGVVGMKVGGVREITIPSDLAYGESGSGDDIPPNTPIRFIVKIIEAV